MNYQITKQNYETANEWHEEKSLGYLWTHELDSFLALIKVKNPKVLDVGCGGSGRDIAQFLERGVHVEGLDYSHTAIEAVKKKFPTLSFHEADMTATGLPDATYDGIWACASILNLPKVEASEAISEFYRLMKQGGALFVSVKRGEGERMVPDKAGERFFSFFSEQEICELVEGAGFTIDHKEIRESLSAEFGWICVYALKI